MLPAAGNSQEQGTLPAARRCLDRSRLAGEEQQSVKFSRGTSSSAAAAAAGTLRADSVPAQNAADCLPVTGSPQKPAITRIRDRKLKAFQQFHSKLSDADLQGCQAGPWPAFLDGETAMFLDEGTKATTIEAIKQHRIVLGKPLVGVPALAEIFHRLGPLNCSSEDTLHGLLRRLEPVTFIHLGKVQCDPVKYTRPLTQGDRVGYYLRVDVQLPMFQRVQALPAATRWASKLLDLNSYAPCCQNGFEDFRDKQRPDGAWLRVVVPSLRKLPFERIPVEGEPLYEVYNKAMQDLCSAGSENLYRILYALLRFVLPWQLTEEQHERLPQLLGDEHWGLWEAVKPLEDDNAQKVLETASMAFERFGC